MADAFDNLSREDLLKLAIKKQELDSSKPLEAAPQQESSLAETAKKILGTVRGAAEVFNPASIPNSIETLVRVGSDRSPRSFGAKMESAKENAVFPPATLDDIAVGSRSLVRAVKDIVTNGKVNPDSIQSIYNEEKQIQKTGNEASINKDYQNAGELGAGLISLAIMGKDVAKSLGAGKKLAILANEKAFDALKPIGKAADKIVDQGRATAIGKQLLDDKIVTAGATFEDVLKRTNDKLDDYGKVIGHFAKQADKARSTDSSIRGIQVKDVIDRAENSIIPDLIEGGAADTAETVRSWLKNNLSVAADGSGEIGFSQAQKIKTTLAKTKAKFATANDSIAKDAFQDVWRLLNDAHEGGIESALKSLDSADDISEFAKAKEAYRNLSDAESLISKTVSRQSKNRAFSLTDYMSGGTGAIIGGSVGGVQGAVGGLALAVGNKLARERGNQVVASGLKNLSEFIESKGLRIK